MQSISVCGFLFRKTASHLALPPCFGAGIDLSEEKFTARHSVDSDGFLTAVYPDREKTTLASVINIVSEWPLAQDWFIAAKLE
jgi:hypothetical protein